MADLGRVIPTTTFYLVLFIYIHFLFTVFYIYYISDLFSHILSPYFTSGFYFLLPADLLVQIERPLKLNASITRFEQVMTYLRDLLPYFTDLLPSHSGKVEYDKLYKLCRVKEIL